MPSMRDKNKATASNAMALQQEFAQNGAQPSSLILADMTCEVLF
jgi:hypothetical protein